jgi:drug/metabolite transporter (DMT)-like permease
MLTVVLGLASAAAWGAADFGGGLTGRRAPVMGVLAAAQAIGAGAALLIMILRGDAPPTFHDATWAVAAGVCGAVGLAALYRGLAGGRMGIVAPVTGVLAAAIPVVVGIALAGLPGPLRIVGFGLGIAAVILVSSADDGSTGRRGLGLALGAGTALGLYNVAISRASPAGTFGVLVVSRLTATLVVILLARAGRSPTRLAPRVLPAAAVVGLLDMAGNAAFIVAAQVGRLDVAGLLSSLYPVSTVILAVVFLGERVTRAHAAGILVAGAAVALIALG